MTDDFTRRLGAPLCSLTSARGELHIWRPRTGLFVTRIVGYLSTDGAKEIAVRFRTQVVEDATHTGFHDWSQMDDYDFDARSYLTRVTFEVLPSVKAAHFFVRSRVVAFGVQAANLLLHRFTLHPSEASFEKELLDTLVRRGSVPPSATAR